MHVLLRSGHIEGAGFHSINKIKQLRNISFSTSTVSLGTNLTNIIIKFILTSWEIKGYKKY